MKFDDYHIDKRIKTQLRELGFNRPTDIQFKSIKHILDGEDVMAVAQTGTGKTAAFVIPILDQLIRDKKQGVLRCLVMVPTRELALQIDEVFKSIGKELNIKSLALFGGVEQDTQIEKIRKGIDVLITTPGRMFDLISQGVLKVDQVKHLVLDEADLMLDMGFAKDIIDVQRHIPKKRQTLFFSATISKKVKKAAYDLVRNAIRIQISPKDFINKNINHAVMSVDMDDKRFFLENIVKEYPEIKIVAFVRTQVRVERVVEAMKRVGIDSEGLHGGVEQQERFDILNRFRSGDNRLLITTDVAARGIDIPNVELVINYDVPDDPENYVHRCGRTGRGTNRGQALTFCSDREEELLKAIEEYTGQEIERFEISKGEYRYILEDSDDESDDWQSLIDRTNKEEGTEDQW